MVWQKTYGGLGNDYASSVEQISNADFIVAGYTTSIGGESAWVLQLTSSGTVVWQRIYGGTGDESLSSLRVDNDYVDYFMGQTIDTNHDIQSKGIEHLRSIYAQANLAITPRPKLTPREMLEKMVRSVGLDPGKVLNSEALAEPHRTHATPRSGRRKRCDYSQEPS